MSEEAFDENEWVNSFTNIEEVREIKMAFDLFDVGKEGFIRPKGTHPSSRI
jgi:hypothetical protein